METGIWKRIRGLRERKGLTGKEVGEKMGISRSFYSQIEGGKRRLTADHVEKIARALGVPVSEIYGEAHRAVDDASSFEHLRPVNPWRLRKKLEPVLGDRARDFVECFQMWIAAPEQLKRALRAFSEDSEKPDAREEDDDTPER